MDYRLVSICRFVTTRDLHSEIGLCCATICEPLFPSPTLPHSTFARIYTIHFLLSTQHYTLIVCVCVPFPLYPSRRRFILVFAPRFNNTLFIASRRILHTLAIARCLHSIVLFNSFFVFFDKRIWLNYKIQMTQFACATAAGYID